MSLVIVKGGLSYPVLLGSLKIKLGDELSGCDTEFSVIDTDGGFRLANHEFVSFSHAGVSVSGRVASVSHQREGGMMKYSAKVAGPQEFLLRTIFPEVDYPFGTVQDIGEALTFGTGLTFVLVGSNRTVYGFRFTGGLGEALQRLAAQGRYRFHIRPDRSLYFIDEDDPSIAPFAAEIGSPDNQANLPNKNFSTERPVTRVIVTGGVEKKYPDDPDEESITKEEVADGSKNIWKYSDLADQVGDIKLDGIDQTPFLSSLDPDVGTAVVINHRRRREFEFVTTPTAGQTVSWTEIHRKTRGVAQNDALIAQLVAAVSGFDGIYEYGEDHPELHTQFECEQLAQALLEQFQTDNVDIPITRWGNAGIAYSGDDILVSDPLDGFNRWLVVKTNTIEWDLALGHWKQVLQVGTRKPGGGALGGSGQPVTLPTEYSSETDFTIEVVLESMV